jgi:thioredoxin-related protein
VLIFLWHHERGSSRAMEAETYPDEGVQGYIEGNFVPVEFNALEQPEVAERFDCSWTPTIIFEDAEGREHRRSEGYLDPRRLVGEASLARLKDALDRRETPRSQPTTLEKL